MKKSSVCEEITYAVIKAVLGSSTAEKYANGKLSIQELTSATGKIAGFKDLFTARQQDFGNYLNSEQQLQAYALYYLFPNLAKVTAVLDFCLQRGWLKLENGFKAADLGCGPGVGSLGIVNLLLQNFSSSDMPLIKLTAADQSAQALKLAGQIIQNLAINNIQMNYRVADLTKNTIDALAEPQNLIILANVVNELFRSSDDPAAARADLIAGLLKQHLTSDGLLLIIEPALQSTSRELHALRDQLIQQGLFVLAPCTHQQICPCNRPQNSDDWCHESHYWENPPLIDQLDRLTGLNKHHLKYSFLLLTAQEPVRRPDFYYSVASPQFTKGSMKVSACNELGFSEMIYSGRSKGTHNRSFKKLEKGSRFQLTGKPVAGSKFVITPEMRVEIED